MDKIILQGTFLGWILRDPSRIPGVFPISPKWRFILFGLGTIQYANHPEGVIEMTKARSAERRAKKAAKKSAGADAGLRHRVRRRRPTPPPSRSRCHDRSCRTRGVRKKFSGIIALDHVDIDVDEGERVGLIGPNGAGKTTFFNCILGVLRTDGGVVQLDGDDISGLRVHERARLGIGRTFQRIELFPDSTVRDHLVIAERVRRGERKWWKDICLARQAPTRRDRPHRRGARPARPPRPRRRADRAAEPRPGPPRRGRPGADDPATSAAARRAVVRPRPPETAALATTLREVQAEQGFAILLVEHDVELVSSFTDRCYVLDFGRMIASGTTAEVMASPEMRDAYLGDLEVPT